ncbi:hypothetical protein C4D60_Mb10t25680 [Musa balbisiana]|uniref:Uncharacterized protein n=1 Tax=Musa balbisiana TaxID=52838 RepID=A0A4S8IZW7_MUSBA|nr:hypothetical protein C4D60_Mb10t25680 [Musa balbisiana]
MAEMAPGSSDSGERVDSTVRLPALTSQVAPPLPSFRRDAPSTKQHRTFEQQLGGRNPYRVPRGRSSKEINPKLRIYKGSNNVSYSWKPQQCQSCISFGHTNGACQQTPKPINKIYRPSQVPQQQGEPPPVVVEPVVMKMSEHSKL